MNGLYWGMYYLHERPDDRFAESYLGGDKDDYDVIKHTPHHAVAGDATPPRNYAALLESGAAKHDGARQLRRRAAKARYR